MRHGGRIRLVTADATTKDASTQRRGYRAKGYEGKEELKTKKKPGGSRHRSCRTPTLGK
jgi:hypothetical protein